MVEPVFGQIKEGRGFRQFLPRGLEKVPGERSLICTTHNLLEPYRHGRWAGCNGRRPSVDASDPSVVQRSLGGAA